MTEKIYSMDDWAWSAGNRPISLFSSHNLQEIRTKSPILFIGGVHGDEPEGVRLAEDWLAKLMKQDFEQKPWILIPCINPDGYEKRERTNENGVDLNRNFPSKCWSPDFEKKRYFPGKTPGSEKETQALIALIKEVKPNLIVHFHSWKPMIVFSNTKAKEAAQFLEESSSYEAKEDIGYPTPGSLGEYAGLDLDIGVICIEEQDELSTEEMEVIYSKFEEGLVKISTQS